MDPELINEFVRESYDLLDNVEPTLIELSDSSDQGNVSPELINTTFRLFHSLKGNAGFLDFKSIAALTHEAETVLDLVRHNELTLNTEITLVLCESMDLLRAMLATIEKTSTDAGYEEKVEEVSVKLKGVSGKTEEVVEKKEIKIEISEEMRDIFVKEGSEQLETAEQALLSFFGEEKDSPKRTDDINEAFRNIHSFKGNCGFMGLVHLESISHLLETASDEIRLGHIESTHETQNICLKAIDTLRDGVDNVRNGGDGKLPDYDISVMLMDSILPNQKRSDVPMKKTVSVPTVASVRESTIEDSKAASAGVGAASITRRDIRVDLSKLDSLIDLIGELVISEAMVTRCPAVADIEDQYYERSKDQLRRICENLQDIAMSIRMVPLSATFKKMIRLVHDLSLKASKEIKLHISGENTEVDKTVIEQISDPLVHIIRNSCDHGVEMPSERIAAGKKAEGNVYIDAKHEGGEVWIVITDDGKGLAKEKILDKAISRGLIDPAQMTTMKDSDIFNLIFEPGFSTAEKITNISGRGVGMDVVKKNIESLNGKIDVDSKEGKGTTFVLRIPLTLAIIDGMLVRVGKSCYVIPLLTIKESLRATKEAITIMPDGIEYFRLREDMVPILRLHQLFKCKPDSEDVTEGILIVIEDDSQTVAIFVDEILGQQQTVIKGISEFLGDAQFCSGCTILGNGTVSLILNMSALVANGLNKLQAEAHPELNVDSIGGSSIMIEEKSSVDVSSDKAETGSDAEAGDSANTTDVYINPKFAKKKKKEKKADDKEKVSGGSGEQGGFDEAEVYINPDLLKKKKKVEKKDDAVSENKEVKSEKSEAAETKTEKDPTDAAPKDEIFVSPPSKPKKEVKKKKENDASKAADTKKEKSSSEQKPKKKEIEKKEVQKEVRKEESSKVKAEESSDVKKEEKSDLPSKNKKNSSKKKRKK